MLTLISECPHCGKCEPRNLVYVIEDASDVNNPFTVESLKGHLPNPETFRYEHRIVLECEKCGATWSGDWLEDCSFIPIMMGMVKWS